MVHRRTTRAERDKRAFVSLPAPATVEAKLASPDDKGEIAVVAAR